MNKTLGDYKNDLSKFINDNIAKLHIDLYKFFQNYELMLEEVDTMLGPVSSTTLRQQFTDKYTKLKDVEAIVLDLMGLFKLQGR